MSARRAAACRAARVVGLALIASVAACSGDKGPTGPAVPTSPIAAYALSTVDSKPLPLTMFADTGYVVEITTGAITLASDKTFTSSVTTRETVDGNVSLYVEKSSGTWVQTSGSSAITLTPKFGSPSSAVWSGFQLTVTQTDGVFKYTREP